ncbi:MAG: hypothetical protein L3J36_08670 [Rhodobacteraceae bacterium]|nr:hypothetical protein [Paracoccaceae bacterium]
MRKLTRKPLFALAIASLMLPAAPIMAQPVPGAILYTVILPAGEFGSAAYTAVVVSGLASAKKFCGALDEAYRIDCLAERFGVLSQAIPKDSEYAEVQRVLKSASDQMANLARNNRSQDLPRGKATRPGTTETTTRVLTPTSQATSVQVNKQAQAILAQTETLLLRSAEGSRSKTLQYAKIARAVGSNKVLLRTA